MITKINGSIHFQVKSYSTWNTSIQLQMKYYGEGSVISTIINLEREFSTSNFFLAPLANRRHNNLLLERAWLKLLNHSQENLLKNFPSIKMRKKFCSSPIPNLLLQKYQPSKNIHIWLSLLLKWRKYLGHPCLMPQISFCCGLMIKPLRQNAYGRLLTTSAKL